MTLTIFSEGKKMYKSIDQLTIKLHSSFIGSAEQWKDEDEQCRYGNIDIYCNDDDDPELLENIYFDIDISKIKKDEKELTLSINRSLLTNSIKLLNKHCNELTIKEIKRLERIKLESSL